MSQARDIQELVTTVGVELETVKRHIEKYPKCIHFCDSNISVLDQAVLIERLDIIKLLIESGIQINAQDSHGMTSLHLATQDGLLEIASLLINSGADVHQKDNDGWAAIHFAIDSENQQVMEWALKQDVDLTVTTNAGEDLLTFAKDHGGEAASWFEGVLKSKEEALILETVMKDLESPSKDPQAQKKSSSTLRI